MKEVRTRIFLVINSRPKVFGANFLFNNLSFLQCYPFYMLSHSYSFQFLYSLSPFFHFIPTSSPIFQYLGSGGYGGGGGYQGGGGSGYGGGGGGKKTSIVVTTFAIYPFAFLGSLSFSVSLSLPSSLSSLSLSL